MNTPFRGTIAAFFAIAGFNLSTHAQMVITQPPIGQTNASIGQLVSFSVEVYSTVTTNLQFQWKINGVNIPNATNNTFSITNAEPTNGGEFSVVISDGQTAIESPYAPLAFNVPLLAGKAFANRLALTPVTNGIIRSDNTTAAAETNGPVVVSDVPGGKGGKRIWFSWTPTASSIVTFSTLGSGFETVLGAFTGTAVTNLAPVPSAVNDDDSAGNLTSRIMFNAVSNIEYDIAVDGYWGAYGNVLLSWNEDITQNFLPSFLAMPRGQSVVSNGASTSFVAHWNTGECDWFFNGMDTSIEQNTLTIAAAALTNSGKYVIQVSADDDLHTTTSRPARLEINVLQDGTTATNSFAWPKFLDAANAPFAPQPSQSAVQAQDAGDTRGYSVSQVFSTVGNSSEPGEPSVCAQIPAHPCWYVYVAPTNGSMMITTTGSTFNTVVGVFTGPGNSFSTLTTAGCGYTTNHVSDGQPQIFIQTVPASQTNFIVVDGYNGAKGVVQLNINLGHPIAVNSAPQNQAVVPGSNATLSVDASGSTPVNYSWKFNGKIISNATNSALTLTNVHSAQAGTYTVTISNPLSSTNVSAVLSVLNGETLPVITVQPISRTVPLAASASVAVVATGIPAPTYQWLFNGTVTGSAASSLAIASFQTANQGSYAVVVSNSAGSITSSNAILLLDSPLRVALPSLSGGSIELQLIGSAGGNFVIQSSTNLAAWTPLVTNNAPTGYLNFTDTNAILFPYRFYRGVTN